VWRPGAGGEGGGGGQRGGGGEEKERDLRRDGGFRRRDDGSPAMSGPPASAPVAASADCRDTSGRRRIYAAIVRLVLIGASFRGVLVVAFGDRSGRQREDRAGPREVRKAASVFIATCHGTCARATSIGLPAMESNVLSSRRTISLSRLRAVRPPITTPMTCALSRTRRLTPG